MRFTIARKLGVSFLIVLVLMIVTALYCYVKLQQLSAAQNDLMDKRLPIAFTTYDIRTANNRVNAALQEYLLLGDDPARRQIAQKDVTQTWERLDSDIARLQDLQRDVVRAEDREMVAGLQSEMAAYKTAQMEIIRTAYAGKKKDQKKIVPLFKERVLPMASLVRKTANELQSATAKDMEAQDAAVDAASAATLRALVFGFLSAMAIATVLATVVSRKFAHLIGRVAVRAQVVAKGDLSQAELSADSRDEIGDLTVAVNLMQSNLRSTLESVATAAEQVANASEEISANASQAASGAEKQIDQTTQAATAMQEMSSTISQMSENASLAAAAARQTSADAQQGGTAVEQALSIMDEISNSTRAVSGRIEDLGKNSERIGSIINVIEDIADQTNLLALNAAIEAARAGEQGRGFAVVADEVRKLAEKTSSATKEIAGMIRSIQDNTGTAVEAMRTGQSKVHTGVDKTKAVGEALQGIIGEAERVGDMISQIATAVTEQSSASEEIRRTVEEIAKIIRESGEGSKQSALACNQLSELALDLQQTLQRFKLNGSGRADATANAKAGNTSASSKTNAAHA